MSLGPCCVRLALAALLSLPIFFSAGCTGTTGSPNGLSGSHTGPTPGSGDHSVTLSWSAGTAHVSAYNVYRAEVITGPYQKLKTIQAPGNRFVDLGLAEGIYYYVVTSVGDDGMESADSAPAIAKIPE